ncbi:MAG TPA: hypothetical protein VHC97_10310 [Thermoanaerobaculia bacterium]|jgi:predicted RNase H-like nuclease (RuvC/YqgF family)|nr:hypothetical protein [Thermoanaerobaculia bacterium]
MAAKGQSLAEKLSRWGIAASNLKEHLEEMPHVAPDVEAMDKVISEARALESQLEGIRGQAREVGAKLQEMARDGEKLRSRLRAHLQAKFGPTSESLVKFGFRPRRTPRRAQTVEKPVPEDPGPVVTKPVAQP